MTDYRSNRLATVLHSPGSILKGNYHATDRVEHLLRSTLSAASLVFFHILGLLFSLWQLLNQPHGLARIIKGQLGLCMVADLALERFFLVLLKQ